ncbi:MAG: TldD/PmbA family protein [Candidatus Hodarchaeota archaeon]
MKEKLMDIGEKAIRKTEAMGANQTEVYLTSTRKYVINAEKGEVRSASEKIDAGCGIRAVLGNKMGFAFVTTTEEADIIRAAVNAVQMAKISYPDPDFVSLPSYNESYQQVKGIFDPTIEKITADEATILILRTVNASREALKGKKGIIEALIEISCERKVITNSLGISATSKTTNILLDSDCTIKNEHHSSSFESQVSCELNSIDPEWVGRSAVENTLNNQGAKYIENGEMPVILSPSAVTMILGMGFGRFLNAAWVQERRSPILDVMGEKIASKELQIVDNGLMPGGVGSRPFDAEGVPSQRTEILTSGILKNLLHNSYTANKDGVKNTGNASRSSYAEIPVISPSNFVISPGKGSQDDLVSEIDKGVLCKCTYDQPNAVGELSALIMEGFYIAGGEIKHPLKGTLFGINMKDLLQGVCRIGTDTRMLKAPMGSAVVVSPSIVIKSAKITSG